jgi:hypothetical protein
MKCVIVCNVDGPELESLSVIATGFLPTSYTSGIYTHTHTYIQSVSQPVFHTSPEDRDNMFL